MTLARSGLPPLLSATTAAMSAGTPDAVSHRTISACGTGGNGDLDAPTRHRGQLGRDLVGQQHEHGVPGGSSSVLSRAGARSAARCTSRTTITWRARVQRPALGQGDDLADLRDRDRGAAPTDDVEVGVGAGQRGPARRALSAATLGAQQRGGETVGRRQAAVSGRTAEEVCMHRVGCCRPQGRHRLVLAHHAGEQRRRRPVRGHGSNGGVAGGSPRRSRTDLTIRPVRASGSSIPSKTSQWSGSASAWARNPSRTRAAKAGPNPLDPVGPAASTRRGKSAGRHLDRHVHEDRQVGRHPRCGPGHEHLASSPGSRPCRTPGRPWSIPRSGRSPPTRPAASAGLDHGGHVLGPVGRHQQCLGPERRSGVVLA